MPAPPMDSPFVVDITIEATVNHTIDSGWVADRLRAAAALSPRHVAAIEARIVDDARMIDLHGHHLQDRSTTDVLSFDLAEPGQPMDLHLVLCADEAARQAAARGHSIDRELLLYAIHGMLHCAEFDDHSEVDHARMHAEEDRILVAIGVGRVFADTDRKGLNAP